MNADPPSRSQRAQPHLATRNPTTADELGECSVIEWLPAATPTMEFYVNGVQAGLPDYDQLMIDWPLLEGRELAEATLAFGYHRPKPEGFAGAVAASWQHYKHWEKFSLLKRYWKDCRCPEMETLLESTVSQPFTRAQWHVHRLSSIALARLYEFQPERVREIILADLRRPSPLLTGDALLILPDEVLPEFEPMWAEILRDDIDGDWDKVVNLIERYATRAMVPHVGATLGTGWACDIQEALLGYLIKHDRPLGLRALEVATRRRGPHTGCYRSVLARVLPRYWGEDAERLAIPFLDDPEPEVAGSVARMLCRYGSTASVDAVLEWVARQPLTERKTVLRQIGERWTLGIAQQAKVRDLLNVFTRDDLGHAAARNGARRHAPGAKSVTATR